MTSYRVVDRWGSYVSRTTSLHPLFFGSYYFSISGGGGGDGKNRVHVNGLTYYILVPTTTIRLFDSSNAMCVTTVWISITYFML